MPGSLGSTTEQLLIAKFKAALEDLPDITVAGQAEHIAYPGEFQGPDVQITLETDAGATQLLVEAKTGGYPRDLRDIAMQFSKYAAGHPDTPFVLMIVADAISPGGKALLRQEGIGYWDCSGSLYLKLPRAVFYVDKPRERQAPRVLKSLYHRSSAQVLHTLLMEPTRAWHVQDLALQAGISSARTYSVLVELERHLWVEKQGRGPKAVRLLVDPGALLDGWAKAHTLREYSFHAFYGWSQSPAKLRTTVTGALDRHEIPYALTLTSGAELVAPFAVGHERLEILVQDYPTVEKAALEAGLKQVDDGENVVFLLTKERSPFLFRQRIDGIQVASAVQLYLDLYASPRRGKEQAEHLRSERLSF